MPEKDSFRGNWNWNNAWCRLKLHVGRARATPTTKRAKWPKRSCAEKWSRCTAGCGRKSCSRRATPISPRLSAPTFFRRCANWSSAWAVSSTNQWIIGSAMRFFGIPHDRILATEVAIENGIISDRLIRVPSGPGKPEAIRSVLKSALDWAFGNAIWDREMLAMCGHAFAVNTHPDLKEIAIANGWTVYQPKASGAGAR